MICTAPCIPPCTNEATRTLLNASSKAVLGFNCEAHLAPLINKRQPDYEAAPLPEEKQQ